jgi:hypothetical protein
MIFFGFFGKKTVFRRNTPRQISNQRTFSPSNMSPKDKNKKKTHIQDTATHKRDADKNRTPDPPYTTLLYIKYAKPADVIKKQKSTDIHKQQTAD